MERPFLDRLHGKERQIVNQADFLLYEGFTVAHAGKQSVVARLGKCSLAISSSGTKSPPPAA